MIIFLEDVGQEGLWPDVEALRGRVLAGDWLDPAVVYRWVALMCAAPKSRGGSHARAVASACDGPLAAERYPGVAELDLPRRRTARELADDLRRRAAQRLGARLRVASRARCHRRSDVGNH